MKSLRNNRTFFYQPIPKITPLAQPITNNNKVKFDALLQTQQALGTQNFFLFQKNMYIETSLTMMTNCITGSQANSQPFIIQFEFLSYDQLVNDKNKKYKYGFLLIKNFEELEIFTDNEEVYYAWNTFLKSKLIMHNFHESYDVKKLIGKGHFAKVYYALSKETQKPYAIKAFSKEGVLSEKNGQESIINEIFVMRKLHHPHCLKLHEVYETENSLYFVIELIQGGELLKRISSQKNFHEKDVKILIRNLLKALKHCHKQQIMHRDMKPENLLLRDNTNIHDIVLADFGLATELIPGEEDQILFKRCGTPGYVAPEVLKWKDNSKQFYDLKCDVFSAGMTGTKVFEGDEQQEVIRINRECKINFSRCKNISDSALDLMKKMLDSNPETRISTPEALQHPFLYSEEENVENEGDEGLDLESILPMIGLQEKTLFNSQQKSLNDSFGSFHFNKKPMLNGQIDTIEKMNDNIAVNSATQFKQRPAPLQKQSSYGRSKLFEKKEEESKNSDGISGKKQVSEMHKKAIMNTMMKGQDGSQNPTQNSSPPKLLATGKSSSFKVKKTNQ